MPQPNTNTELRERVLDIIQHIDHPYALTGLGVDKEGYGKISATDAIMQLITSHNNKLELSARLDELLRIPLSQQLDARVVAYWRPRTKYLEAQLFRALHINLEGEKT